MIFIQIFLKNYFYNLQFSKETINCNVYVKIKIGGEMGIKLNLKA